MFVDEFLRAFSTSLVLAFAVPVFFGVVWVAVLVLVLVLPALAVLAVLAVHVQFTRCTRVGTRQHRVADATQPPVVVIVAVLTMAVAVAVADRRRAAAAAAAAAAAVVSRHAPAVE